MQQPKDKIRKLILKNAKDEFIDKGFSKSSMREVARKTGTTVSNLYTYFKNKDALFLAVVSPVVSVIESQFTNIKTNSLHTDPYYWKFEWHQIMITNVINFIDKHRELLNLLAFKSHGSSIENYKDDLIERYTDIWTAHTDKIQAQFPNIKADHSSFFIHNIASFLFNSITEFLMHQATKEQMLKYSQEIMTFMFYGYEGLYEYDFETMTEKPRQKR